MSQELWKISRLYTKILVETFPKKPRLDKKEREQADSLAGKIAEAIKAMGDYEPAIDDLLIERAVASFIYAGKFEDTLDAIHAEQKTNIDPKWISMYADAIAKFNIGFRKALEALAANRRERLRFKSQAEVENELKTFFEQVEAAADKSPAYG